MGRNLGNMTAGFIPPAAWTETPGQLRQSGQVTLGSSGTGYISFSTNNANQRWVVTQVIIGTNQASTAVIIPFATLALNTTDITQLSASNSYGTSWSGNNDTFGGSPLDVGPVDFMSIIFYPPPGSGGTAAAALAGVIASVTVSGTKYTRRN